MRDCFNCEFCDLDYIYIEYDEEIPVYNCIKNNDVFDDSECEDFKEFKL